MKTTEKVANYLNKTLFHIIDVVEKYIKSFDLKILRVFLWLVSLGVVIILFIPCYLIFCVAMVITFIIDVWKLV